MFWRKKYRSLKRNITCNILYGADLKKYTSFHIGGRAAIMVFPEKMEDLIKIINLTDGVPIYILGGGTNVLASDEDFSGVIINTRKMIGITRVGNELEVFCGTPLMEVCNFCAENELSGMEGLAGIPGTVGGATVMNAGANGCEIADVITGVLALKDGKISYFDKSECGFDYRKSIFDNMIVYKIYLSLKEGVRSSIKSKMRMFIQHKLDSQPLNLPSAGSVFKRKDGIIVSKMIDMAGLKGYNINDAEISHVHAGFIVNKGNATCKDVLALIDFLKKYFIRQGVELEEEIKILKNDYRRFL